MTTDERKKTANKENKGGSTQDKNIILENRKIAYLLSEELSRLTL